MRRVCYITGTRADFGLMLPTLQAVRDRPGLSLMVLATGMHFSAAHGRTIDEIDAAGLDVAARIEVPLDPATGATMARSIGLMVGAFVDAMEADRPDIVLLLGDRGEMLAGAVAGIHLNIPVAHVCGGERSGTVDEPVRHAISKLSHLHFTATEQARERLIRMGEAPEHIQVVGTPGLDGLTDGPFRPRGEILEDYGLDQARPFALLVYHPVLQEAGTAAADAHRLIERLEAAGCQVLAVMPNADAGSEGVRQALLEAAGRPGFVLRTHLPRADFIQAMRVADLMIGNSSSGIMEAASFGTPVLNVGPRQNMRERNFNILDVVCAGPQLDHCIQTLLAKGRFPIHNIYRHPRGGRAADRIAEALAAAQLDDRLLMKINQY